MLDELRKKYLDIAKAHLCKDAVIIDIEETEVDVTRPVLGVKVTYKLNGKEYFSNFPVFANKLTKEALESKVRELEGEIKKLKSYCTCWKNYN